MNQRILIVDAEANIRQALALLLAREGYATEAVADGATALRRIRNRRPHLVLLDVTLPRVNGIEVCRTLKQHPEHRSIPIIMISARNTECDVVLGIGLGAEDYIAKPYRPRELVARIQNVLRRSSGPILNAEPVQAQGLSIEPDRYQVRVDQQTVALSRTEMRILHCMATHPGIVFTRRQLLQQAKRNGAGQISERNIDVHVRGIRSKIGKYRSMIQTVRRVGYRFNAGETGHAG